MGYEIQNGNTTRNLLFLLVSSTDHITGLTGASPTVTISKNGAAFASPAGAVSEVGNGWYNVAANAMDASTNGPLLLHASATGSDPVDDRFDVVAYNPDDGIKLGLSTFPANFAALGISSSGHISQIDAYTGNTPQGGDAYAIVSDAAYGNAKLTRATVPATTLDTSSVAQTGDGFARMGPTGSLLTSLAPAATALSTAQWTNALAALLNTLAGHDPGGTLASAASQTSVLNAVNAITSNTARTAITVPQFEQLPSGGTSTVLVKIKLYNVQGILEDADSQSVTIHAATSGGTSLDANLASTTATRDSTGQYHATYTIHSTDAEGGVYLSLTYTVGGVSMAADAVFSLAQADTITSIAAILSTVNTINGNVGAAGAGLTSLGDARMAHLDTNVSSRMATFSLPTNFATLAIDTNGDVTFNNIGVATAAGVTAVGSAVTGLGSPQQAGSAVVLPAIPDNWITAAGIAASALDGKGDWSLASVWTPALATSITTLASHDPGSTLASATSIASLASAVGSPLQAGADVVLAASQPNYAPAKAGAQMDLVNAPNATAVAAIQSGLSTPSTAQAIDLSESLPIAPVANSIGWALQILAADQYTDETTDPTQWHTVFTVCGSGAPGTGVTLMTKKLFDTTGAKLNSSGQVVGQASQ